MKNGIFNAALAAALLGMNGQEAALPPLMPVPSGHRPTRGGRREHSNRHTGARKIQREAKRLRNKKRRRQ